LHNLSSEKLPQYKYYELVKEESKAGDAGCDGQNGDELRCDAKTIKTVYNLARSWGFEDAAWNHESRECKTRQAQKQHDVKDRVDRGIDSRA